MLLPNHKIIAVKRKDMGQYTEKTFHQRLLCHQFRDIKFKYYTIGNKQQMLNIFTKHLKYSLIFYLIKYQSKVREHKYKYITSASILSYADAMKIFDDTN